MGKTSYTKMQELLKPIVGKTVHVDLLWRRIMIEVGSDRRTIRGYMHSMLSLGMIVEVRERRYEIISCNADI